MLATLTEGAFDDDDWLYEIKWDGYRVEAVVSGGRARIWTRNRVDAATYFPDLAGPAPMDRCREAIVDGEVVAFDEEGRPSFSRLQEKTGLRGTGEGHPAGRPGCAALTREEREAIPMAYMVFDLLHLDGRSLVDVPLEDRKHLLRRVLRPRRRWCATPPTSWARASTSRRRPPRRDWRGSWPSAGSARTSPGAAAGTG